MDRPEWDDYFMGMCAFVAQRSFDESTKCGCVIVDASNRVLSVGYNGPIRGSDDKSIPMWRKSDPGARQDLPDKYYFMAHSEENCILGATTSLENSTCYITSFPCHRCLRMLIQKGVKRIVYGNYYQAVMLERDPAERIAVENMLSGRDIEIVRYSEPKFIQIFKNAIAYTLERIDKNG